MSDVRLCPVCGSGKVVVDIALVPEHLRARCTSCSWSGLDKDLIVRQLDLGQAEEIAQEVAKDLLRNLAFGAGGYVGRAIVESGVLGKSEGKLLARLIKAAIKAAHKAILEEVDMMQQEIKNGQQ
ncbi:hypothetical protein UFOVP276_169 [uncultured Caudovirales phage]|uniref:Uncharacterized protein n=1 Tax=uncultured Caudovirales phage TaxID=2100421 RepID=A0A6J5LPR5_9CAUD|nr:hypothetical protein UFOVP127_63 [uncultured Caudovirales phage]CAB4135213.1 hypothetical protein UFOVP276_169 [uncultured Caudovirales phage]